MNILRMGAPLFFYMPCYSFSLLLPLGLMAVGLLIVLRASRRDE